MFGEGRGEDLEKIGGKGREGEREGRKEERKEESSEEKGIGSDFYVRLNGTFLSFGFTR